MTTNGKMIIDNIVGTKYWRNERRYLHREDGPAVIWPNGNKEWWLNGNRHREDGPAVECADGGKEWWLNGVQHRNDGPAVMSSDGKDCRWFINGKRIDLETRINTEIEYNELVASLAIYLVHNS